MKAKWQDTYVIQIGNRVIEVDRPTGSKRQIGVKPLAKPFDREDSGGRITYRRKEQ